MSEDASNDGRGPGARVAVFAREPRLGMVKSRLASGIGEPSALAVYRAMLKRTAELAGSSLIAGWDLWVTSNPDNKEFISLCNRKNIYLQKGDDLGARMDYAIQQSLSREDTGGLILIGTDCPALTQHYLGLAVAALSDDCDVVLGPAEDGGYVLIGAIRPVPAIFEGISWGSDQVMLQTIARLEEAQLSYKLLDTLWDVDRPEDLARLEQLDPPLQWDSEGDGRLVRG